MSDFEANKATKVPKENTASASKADKDDKKFEFKYVQKQKFDKIFEKVKKDKKKVGKDDDDDKSVKSSERTPLNSPRGKAGNVPSPRSRPKSPVKTDKDKDKDLLALIDKAKNKLKAKELGDTGSPKKNTFETTGTSQSTDLKDSEEKEDFPRSPDTSLDMQMKQNLKEMQEIEVFHKNMLKQSEADTGCDDLEASALTLVDNKPIAAKVIASAASVPARCLSPIREVEKTELKPLGVVPAPEAKWVKINSNPTVEKKVAFQSAVPASAAPQPRPVAPLPVAMPIPPPSIPNPMAASPQVKHMLPLPTPCQNNIKDSIVMEGLLGSFDPNMASQFANYQQMQAFAEFQNCEQFAQPMAEHNLQQHFEEYSVFHQTYDQGYHQTFELPLNTAYGYDQSYPADPQNQFHYHEDSDLEYELQKRGDYTVHCYPRPNLEETNDIPAEGGKAEFVNVENQNNAINLCYLVNKAPMRFTDMSDDVSEVAKKENPKIKVVMKKNSEKCSNGVNNASNVDVEVVKERTPREKTPKKKLKKLVKQINKDEDDDEVPTPKSAHRELKEHKEHKDHKDNREHKEHKEHRDHKEHKEHKEPKEQKERRRSKERKEHDEIREEKESRSTKEPRSAKGRSKRTTSQVSQDTDLKKVVEQPKSPKSKKEKEISPRKKQGIVIPVIECNAEPDASHREMSPRRNLSPRFPRKNERSPRSPHNKKTPKPKEVPQVNNILVEATRLEKLKVYKKISNIQEVVIEILDRLKMNLVELHTLDNTQKSKNYKNTLEFAVQFTRNFLLPLKTMIEDVRATSEKAFTQTKSNAACNRIIAIYKLIIQAIHSYQKHIRYFCIDSIPNKLVSLLEHLHDITTLTIQKGIFSKDDIVIDCLMQRCLKFVDFINEIIEERMVSARTRSKSPTRSIQSHYFTKKPKPDALEMYDPKVLKEPSTSRSKRSKWLMVDKYQSQGSKTDVVVEQKKLQPEIDPEEDAVPFDDGVETQVGATKNASSGIDTLGVLNNLILSASCNLINDQKISEVTNEAINMALIEALQNTTKTQVVRMLEPYLQILDSAVFGKC